jgi:hypothetical protein
MAKQNEFPPQTTRMDVLPTSASGAPQNEAGAIVNRYAAPNGRSAWSFERLCRKVGGLVASLFSW